MVAASSKAKAETCGNRPSTSMRKTYLRMRLYNALREPKLLEAVELKGQSLRLVTTCWDEYWANTPQRFRSDVGRLKESWNGYYYSGFNLSYAAPYCKAYLELLRAIAEKGKSELRLDPSFLSKVLGLENFVLKFQDASTPFAAATTSFRNPIFLSICSRGMRKNSRNDPSLLPLVVGRNGGTAALYYHYRKQCILKNTDESLLIFPAVDHTIRAQSFQGLQALTESLASEWDSRVDQRSRLLADKTLVPFLRGVAEKGMGEKALRILDIGSGVGLFTSKVITKVLRSEALGARKIEISLLDILPVGPKKYFSSPALLSGLSKVEYIDNDYISWLAHETVNGFGKFDIVFLFRILHNMSEFRIGAMPQVEREGNPLVGRYRMLPHLSDYYQTISLLFPNMANHSLEKSAQPLTFCPERTFNPMSLLTPDGKSLIRRLTEIATCVLIEDGDLTPDALVDHMSRHVEGDVKVYDLSRPLRLSVNHIYWITASDSEFPPWGEMIWPR